MDKVLDFVFSKFIKMNPDNPRVIPLDANPVVVKMFLAKVKPENPCLDSVTTSEKIKTKVKEKAREKIKDQVKVKEKVKEKITEPKKPLSRNKKKQNEEEERKKREIEMDSIFGEYENNEEKMTVEDHILEPNMAESQNDINFELEFAKFESVNDDITTMPRIGNKTPPLSRKVGLADSITSSKSKSFAKKEKPDTEEYLMALKYFPLPDQLLEQFNKIVEADNAAAENIKNLSGLCSDRKIHSLQEIRGNEPLTNRTNELKLNTTLETVQNDQFVLDDKQIIGDLKATASKENTTRLSKEIIHVDESSNSTSIEIVDQKHDISDHNLSDYLNILDKEELVMSNQTSQSMGIEDRSGRDCLDISCKEELPMANDALNVSEIENKSEVSLANKTVSSILEKIRSYYGSLSVPLFESNLTKTFEMNYEFKFIKPEESHSVFTRSSLTEVPYLNTPGNPNLSGKIERSNLSSYAGNSNITTTLLFESEKSYSAPVFLPNWDKSLTNCDKKIAIVSPMKVDTKSNRRDLLNFQSLLSENKSMDDRSSVRCTNEKTAPTKLKKKSISLNQSSDSPETSHRFKNARKTMRGFSFPEPKMPDQMSEKNAHMHPKSKNLKLLNFEQSDSSVNNINTSHGCSSHRFSELKMAENVKNNKRKKMKTKKLAIKNFLATQAAASDEDEDDDEDYLSDWTSQDVKFLASQSVHDTCKKDMISLSLASPPFLLRCAFPLFHPPPPHTFSGGGVEKSR